MSSNSISIDTLLLAAGSSKRMGNINKMLIKIDNETLIKRSAKLYKSLSTSLMVVLGHQAGSIADEIENIDATLLINPNHQAGRQSTVRYGIDHMNSKADALFIALADQHLLNSEDLIAFIAHYQTGSCEKILIPRYKGKRGNPILFPSSVIKTIRDDKNVTNLRKYIDENPDQVEWYEAENNHFTADLDTPEDLEYFGIS